MHTLDTKDLVESGVAVGGEVMPNGETRHRMMFGDGSGYIRTESVDGGAWQNAHYHGGPDASATGRGVRETYIVQEGWAAFAWSDDYGRCHVRVCFPGEVFTTEPGVQHNVYLNGVIHVVKHGVAVGNPEKGGADWWPADPSFDGQTKRLSRLHLANQSDLSGERRRLVLAG